MRAACRIGSPSRTAARRMSVDGGTVQYIRTIEQYPVQCVLTTWLLLGVQPRHTNTYAQSITVSVHTCLHLHT